MLWQAPKQTRYNKINGLTLRKPSPSKKERNFADDIAYSLSNVGGYSDASAAKVDHIDATLSCDRGLVRSLTSKIRRCRRRVQVTFGARSIKFRMGVDCPCGNEVKMDCDDVAVACQAILKYLETPVQSWIMWGLSSLMALWLESFSRN